MLKTALLVLALACCLGSCSKDDGEDLFSNIPPINNGEGNEGSGGSSDPYSKFEKLVKTNVRCDVYMDGYYVTACIESRLGSSVNFKMYHSSEDDDYMTYVEPFHGEYRDYVPAPVITYQNGVTTVIIREPFYYYFVHIGDISEGDYCDECLHVCDFIMKKEASGESLNEDNKRDLKKAISYLDKRYRETYDRVIWIGVNNGVYELMLGPYTP